MTTADVLGPRAVRKDILAYKGVKWSTLFSLAIDNVDLVLATGVLTTSIKKSWDTATIMSFVQEAVDATHCNLAIPAINVLTAGRSEDDPDSKYVYSVIWTSPTTQFVDLYGDLTMGPT